LRSDHNFFLGSPIARIYDYVTDRPAFTVDNKFFDMADISVRRLNIVADDFVGATQVGIG
jgi:hypothetical protein